MQNICLNQLTIKKLPFIVYITADKSKEVEFVSSNGGTKRLSFHYLKSD